MFLAGGRQEGVEGGAGVRLRVDDIITVMVAKTTRSGWTEEQLMALPNIGHKYELIEGRLMQMSGAIRK